jgi:nucleoside-diphosphate-sugar epimerase
LWKTVRAVGGNLLVTGGTGRLGRLLRAVWADRAEGAAWPGRPGSDGAWPGLDAPPGAVILHLAGATGGSAAELRANADLARAVARAARRIGAARVILASTVAVYRPGPDLLDEDSPPDPPSDYGRSKLAAERALAAGLSGSGIAVCRLRIANVAGADALLGGALARPGGPVTLDPVPGQLAGPERSYIGPMTFARVLAALIAQPDLPPVLNLAQPGAVGMADLLEAARLPWAWGPPRPATVPRVVVDVARLARRVPLDSATPPGLVAELTALKGIWP